MPKKRLKIKKRARKSGELTPVPAQNLPEIKLDATQEIPVVAIGYSAGGLDAVQALLKNVHNETGLAFVIIQHLKDGQPSHLAEILSKFTSMPVETIKRETQIRSNSIFVMVPDAEVELNKNILCLKPRKKNEIYHLSINNFFTSLSQARKSKSIGVVLSGAGSDGTLGLKAIKGEGGVAIVQDPKTAKFDSMPRSAIANGVADLILSPEEIAKELERFARHPYTTSALPAKIDAASLAVADESLAEFDKNNALHKIIDTLTIQTRVKFSKYKISTLKRRIERQMMLRKIETIEKYAEYLHKNDEEIKALYEDIFIHVTDFFRDWESFEALSAHVFPALIRNRSKDTPIRVWVPGCATGEEAYSIAICLSEYLEGNSLSHPINIFATDISEPAIQKARKGVYAEYQMDKLSPKRREKFFEKVKEGYKVKSKIRDLCVFSRHDVTSNPPIPKVDFISCRNVLIYFSNELQKHVFPVFHYALNPTGFLWLGQAENPLAFLNLFVPINKANKIYTKVKNTTPVQHNYSAGTYGGNEGPTRPLNYMTSTSDLIRSADQMILFRYSPPSVVVNSNLDILQFRGRTVPYLEPSPGLATYNLLKMANPDLVAALRLCMQAAKRQSGQARKENISFEFEEKKRKVNIDVSTLNPAAPLKERQFLIIFEETNEKKLQLTKAKPHIGLQLSKKERATQVETLIQYNTQLQQELDASREYQQSLIEEYETAQEELTSANEELRSTNEELQSTNEELHSTNEELGTAKEELQVANEDLLNANGELQKRNNDLENSEDRFRLMIEGVKDYAIFMLDQKGFVTSWNEGAKRFKGYLADEIIGGHFSKFYPIDDIARGKPEYELKEASIMGRFEDEGWRLRKDGSRFWANVVITAIRNRRGELLGFSKVTRDLTERRMAEEALRRSHEDLEIKVRERTVELAHAVRSRDEFLSLASHELKTPLTSLLLQAQLRERYLQRPEAPLYTRQKFLEMFATDKRQVLRLNRLIDDMLNVSQITSRKIEIRPERIDLVVLAKEIIDRFSIQFSTAQCEVRFETFESAIGFFDRSRLEQVFVNLFSNAIKYGQKKPVHIKVGVQSDMAYISVRDHGIGIPQEDIDKIFQQFERAANANFASGLGLGLYIVKNIVEGHGGIIRVESAVNEGAKFTVQLPLKLKNI